MIIHCTPDAKEVEADVLVEEVPGHDSLVRVKARILKLRQYFEREVCRVALDDSYQTEEQKKKCEIMRRIYQCKIR